MTPPLSIRILEPAANPRGDLFNRLMSDLFIALGYDQPRLNVHKPGREIDIDANHRLEKRRAIGECKATQDKIGGDELNKLVGRIVRESKKDAPPISGYCFSLAGFKETAIEQEKDSEQIKIVLIDGPKAIEELIAGRVIVSRERATELAGR